METNLCVQFTLMIRFFIYVFFAPQFSMQVDFIRQQLEFEAQQLRSVMEERFGTSDEMVQRTQVRTDYRFNAKEPVVNPA